MHLEKVVLIYRSSMEETSLKFEIESEEETSVLPKKRLNVKSYVHKCPYLNCNAAFSRPFRLQTHLNVHNGERPYKCEVEGCSRAYTNSTNLRRHRQIFHNPLAIKQKYKCTMEYCSEEFCSTSSLRRHIERKHLRKYPFTCDTCQKGFNTSNKLKTHEFEHTSISPFRCELCDVGYITAYDLRRHNRKHKKRLCPICGLEFKNALLLRKHHGVEHRKSYNCATCGKLFFNKAMFTQHEGVHLDPSQRAVFPCPFESCSRFYYAKRNVDHHVRAFHEGKKNNQKCHVCGKQLSNKQKLKQHLELHVRLGVPVKLPPIENESEITEEEEDPEDVQNRPIVKGEPLTDIKFEFEGDVEERIDEFNSSPINYDELYNKMSDLGTDNEDASMVQK